MTQPEPASKLGFLDSLTQFFRKDEKLGPKQAPEGGEIRFASLQADFQAAIRGLDVKVDEFRAQTIPADPTSALPAEEAARRADERERRLEESHRLIREDVEAMHRSLRTGIAASDLPDLFLFLVDIDKLVQAGKDSHEILPRARYAIAARLQTEAGEIAVARLIELMHREELPWPDPTQTDPTATAEETERSRRRRLAETREAFLESGLQRTAERLLGVVKAWGSDYPDRGAPIWKEAVLEAVAAGLRADLLKEFADVLRRDREQINAELEHIIGSELDALRDVLRQGVGSLEQANQAAASAMRVLDDMVPQVAWEHIRTQVPRARGEWPA